MDFDKMNGLVPAIIQDAFYLRFSYLLFTIDITLSDWRLMICLSNPNRKS